MKAPNVLVILIALNSLPKFGFGQAVAEWSNNECQVRVVEKFPDKSNEQLYSAFKSWAKTYFWEGKRVINVKTRELNRSQYHEEASKLFEVMDHLEKLWIQTAYDTVARFYFKNAKRPDKFEYSFFIEFQENTVTFKLYNFYEPDQRTKACESLFSRKGERKEGKEVDRIKLELEAYGNNLMRKFKESL